MKLDKTKKLVLMAVLAALSVVLKLLAVDITVNIRIGLENTPVILAGAWLGPIAGFITGAVADILGCIVKGYSINPIITLGFASVGLVSGLVFKIFGKKNKFIFFLISTEIAEFIGSSIIKSIGLRVYYGTDLSILLLRIPLYMVYAVIDAYVVYMIFKTGILRTRTSNKMNYSEAINYIHSVSWMGSKPGLERINALCEKLGHPEDSLRFIHIAGTNGKGSVSSMTASVLMKAGYSVGLFTSPYVYNFNERIRLNGEDISDDELAEVTEYVKSFAETMEDKPTEFELITAIGLEYFKRKKPDFVVFECGLGGRLDSTNVIKTTVLSVITGIDLDHTALLGDTTAKIALEKAGIIKENVPVLYGEVDKDAGIVIAREADRMKSDAHQTDFSLIGEVKSDLTGTTFLYDGKKYHINLLGIYQTRNASTVIRAVDILRAEGITISDEALKEGLESAKWRARFEILSANNPLVIYDGAHNPQGIDSAVENIKHYLAPVSQDGKIVLLMGVMADKNHASMTEKLSPYIDRVFTVYPDNSRSLGQDELLAEFKKFEIEGESFESVSDGVKSAVAYAREQGRPLICLGSLYMYHDVYDAVLRETSR